MPVFAVHMLVRDFLSRSGANRSHLARKAYGLASEGVVAVKMHLRAFDFDHVEDLWPPVVAAAARS